ncbi:hypothetical protein RBA41_01890 [Massilia sp. CCM 9210]|uniref:hypothetical protein n=1 Tax=Massilia scottii TaxID=3057166 RepID=UPI0027964AAD|nr:hypothetical protein [Massilia sp. CCM 9210]MDQ1812044.1 hypothetical protein [Massilia sp. CCM 9210]
MVDEATEIGFQEISWRGRFLVAAAGSPGAVITYMVADSQQAFFGATSLAITID